MLTYEGLKAAGERVQRDGNAWVPFDSVGILIGEGGKPVQMELAVGDVTLAGFAVTSKLILGDRLTWRGKIRGEFRVEISRPGQITFCDEPECHITLRGPDNQTVWTGYVPLSKLDRMVDIAREIAPPELHWIPVADGWPRPGTFEEVWVTDGTEVWAREWPPSDAALSGITHWTRIAPPAPPTSTDTAARPAPAPRSPSPDR